MAIKQKKHETFRAGATWLRADFHLHTKADKEFKYTDEEDYYFSNYVEALEKAEIKVGVIANHNKFDVDEFRALRKTAAKKEILLLPGVELSVNDGANGVHVLVVFSDEWLKDGKDYISLLITSMFPGKDISEYQNENGRTDKNILEVVDELEKTARDYFLVFAHVEQKSGLWHEMGGGKLSDFRNKRYETVRQRTLGFQKVRTRDERKKVEEWLGNWYPAEVEGCDCKSIADIGNGKECYIKIGAFSFEAVKFALIDQENRIADVTSKYEHSYIRAIRFTGGILNGQEINFSPGLNTLIGIRGSGKSAILEVIRYALEIPFGEKAGDLKYKGELLGFAMGSGGKVEIDAIDRYGQHYIIRRVWKESHSEVLVDNQLRPGVSIRETVLHKPIYFGQKDLSSTGEGFEKDLVEKLLGSKLDYLRQEIEVQKSKVIAEVDQVLKLTSVSEQIAEQKAIKQDTEHRLKFYADHGIEEKLQKRLDFEKDIQAMQRGINLVKSFLSDLTIFLANHEDNFNNFKGHVSKHNKQLFEAFYDAYEPFIKTIKQIKTDSHSLLQSKEKLLKVQEELADIRKGLTNEFAEIERKLAEELKSSGAQNISSEEFLALQRKLNIATQQIEILEEQSALQTKSQTLLLEELRKLNDLWHEEFISTKRELDKIGANGTSLSIESGYKEDRQAFLTFMMDMFKGSGIREVTYKGIVEKYQDFIDIYKNFEEARKLFGANPQVLSDLFMKNLKDLLIYQTPNKFSILYKGKQLEHHSLGQRASALILFVLSQKENDIIIIDQPEDDLDNQTIYEDVITLIKELKPEVQFIFATHNPNIPVLGDAELVHACSFEDNEISVKSGSIDNGETQQTIVKIMEGGKEAFERRKEIYQIWKP